MASNAAAPALQRKATVTKPRRSAAAAEGIALLKRGAAAIKQGRENYQKRHPVTFKLDEEETELTWEPSLLGKITWRSHERRVRLVDIIELQVGRDADVRPDLLALERTHALENSPGRQPHAGQPHPRPPSACVSSSKGEYDYLLTLLLVGSLPQPPSAGDDDRTRQHGKLAAAFCNGKGERASLVLQMEDEDSFGLWLAALRALLAERQPPSPIGPSAIMGSFGCDLEEARARVRHVVRP